MHKLATIQRLGAIEPIPGADRIEMSRVLGYRTVIEKGAFKPNDLCVWHAPDTVLPDRPEYEFLRKQEFRIKVAKFRGVYSQGLALPINKTALCVRLGAAQLVEGEDVTDLIGIKKYEKVIPEEMAGESCGGLPGFTRRTSEFEIRSHLGMLDGFVGKAWYATLKMNGTSGTWYFKDGVFGCCGREYEYLPTEGNLFWRMARKYDIEAKLRDFGGNVVIQGEVFGPEVHKNTMGASEVQLGIFNLWFPDEWRYAGYGEMRDLQQKFDLPLVPEVLLNLDTRRTWQLQEFIDLAERQAYTNGKQAEGIVVRPLIERSTDHSPSGRLSFKVLNEAFLHKHGE